MIPKLLKFTALALAAMIAAGVSAWLAVTLIVRSEQTVTVPDLTGKTAVVALQMLTELRLNAKYGGAEYNDAIPGGRVLRQDVAPGETVKQDRDVHLVLSNGPKRIIMPDLAGMALRNAEIALEEDGLCLGTRSSAGFETVPAGFVASQFPASGAWVTRDACVDLLVSTGKRPERFTMPDLSGMPADQAVVTVESLRLGIGEIRSEALNAAPIDSVIRQKPAAGRRVAAGEPVTLVVNRSPGANHRYAGVRKGVRLIRHRTRPGFLNRRVRIEITGYGLTAASMEEFVGPGEEVRLIVPDDADIRVHIFEDDVSVDEQATTWRLSDINQPFSVRESL